jgi:hypothetical protein
VKQREHGKQQAERTEQQQTGDAKMFTKSKIALSLAVVLGAASAAHADGVKEYGGIVVRPSPNVDSNPPAALSTKHARGSYASAQVHVRPSPNVDPNASSEPTGSVRAPSSFEKTWFDFQNHDDQ